MSTIPCLGWRDQWPVPFIEVTSFDMMCEETIVEGLCGKLLLPDKWNSLGSAGPQL